MAGYRLYFVDDKGAIQAREEFIAADDDAALIVSEVVYRACSDACFSYELWQGDRRVIAYDSPRANTLAAPTDQQTVEIQEIALSLEESLQRSQWTIARSEKLLREAQALKERARTFLPRQVRPQDD